MPNHLPAALTNKRQQSVQHAVKIVVHVAIGDAVDAVAELFQSSRTRRIGCDLLRRAVGCDVDLDHDLVGTADDVGEPGADGDLAVEFQAGEFAVAQAGPEFEFRRRRGGAQGAGAVGSPGLLAAHVYEAASMVLSMQ